ncbi:MAG: DEAD/DEAH box helicase [Anaerolineaceae bacterium]|nr:DEAD/DEAH box helicase [Anaerolineaceae bacterium]
MMESDLKQYFDSPKVVNTIKDLDTRQMEHEVGASFNDPGVDTVNILRLAAITSFIELVNEHRVDVWFKPSNNRLIDKLRSNSRICFFRWQGYFDALVEINQSATLDDMLMFSVAGLIGNRDHEVRDELRRPQQRQWLDHLKDATKKLSWIEQVRANISVAILFIIRQENRNDINNGNSVLEALAKMQERNESDWIAGRNNQKRDASILIGNYLLAESVILTAKFLADGIVEIDGKIVSDFVAELRRLVVKSEEFMELSGDQEQLLWLKTASCAVAHLRSSSIWVQAKGISERVDKLLNELASTNREQPVFSLLPAQQDALRQSLLDPSRMAIVLQMPTSSGKTLLAEFSIAQTFDAFRGTARAVYIVPTRALATQVRRTLTEDLRPLGIKVSAAGSAFEDDPYEVQLIKETDGVVVSTPEKLDLLLRAHSDWFKLLRIVVVDEAHLIQDKERGVHLELLLANIRREQPDARLLLLTPFMENAQEIAEWLSRERSNAISILWRPTRVLLGMAKVSGAGQNRSLTIEWTDPYNPEMAPRSLKVPTNVPSSELMSNIDRVIFLADKFQSLGTVLAIFSASPAEAEEAAIKQASKRRPIASEKLTPQMRVAIAISRREFGSTSRLADCLEHGTAFHHSSLPPILRYLIEDQIRDKSISFVSATSTLAQGMNFPVATILIHSVHKPYGGGNFSPSEFWNIAGRAGRVGLAEKGLVIFSDRTHQKYLNGYSQALSESLHSALLNILDLLDPSADIKDQYRNIPEIRPFIQYLAHAAATSSAREAYRNLEALIEQSLVNQQVTSISQSRKLRTVAQSYLLQLMTKSGQLIKAADVTGLGTFSFDELYAKLRDDPILRSGPREVIGRGQEGLFALIDALKWLPELNLAIGYGEGKMNVSAVAKAVQSWINGEPVYKIATDFPGADETKRIREASRYLNNTVSQTLSWGAHAFIRGWIATPAGSRGVSPEDSILPSFIQYGVKTPEAVVASLLGVPRSFAEATADEYRERHGKVTTENVGNLRDFIESAGESDWSSIIQRSAIPGLTGKDFHQVFREMQGLG